jgi:hypothetical protein
MGDRLINLEGTRTYITKLRGSLWVNRVTLTACRSLPIFPDKQACAGSVGMSQTSQQETHAPQQKWIVTREQISVTFDTTNIGIKSAKKAPEE